MASINPVPSEGDAARAARAWRASLPRERRRSTNLRGGLFFGVNAALYLFFFLGVFLLSGPWLQAACLVSLPWTIGGLFVLGHDAAHNSLTPTGWLNRVLGRLSMLPAYHPYTSWGHVHNTLHHGGTCLKGKHPDFAPLSKEEYDRLPRWWRWLEHVYRSPLGVGLCYVLDFYLRCLLFPRPRCRPSYRLGFHLDRVLVLSFLGFQLWAAYALTALTPGLILPRWLHAGIAVLGPWIAWIFFMGVASFVQHTHPRTAWYEDPEEWSFYHVQLRSSTHTVLPWPLGRLLHNIMDHPAHHIDPTIPLYELPASQKLLEDRAPEHSVIVNLTPWEYLRICRICKLYDYRRHCWTDFEGRPTTPTGLHTLGIEKPRPEVLSQQVPSVPALPQPQELVR
jgi:acyl-lipid omega-6 desaturase (Delta-12 desaturase)